MFTTNYDTLLEKAAQSTYERKYDVVASPADIPAQERPRIVKLHGSFPHQRPFIITEEDFRTYRERFAPFVNLVQQSAQENVLVLLGFSGEDPNFLGWTGWVRDNLGENAPTVYLCGLLDLSSSERQLLDRRKVAPVDLSPLFPATTWPDRDERHQKAAEWFLLNLMSGKPPNPDDWLGKREQSSRWTPSFGLPRLPQPRSLVLQEASTPMPFSARETEQTEEIIEIWRAQREEYPGWVVAPREKRERLVSDTEHWIYPVLNVADNMSPQEGIHLLYELNWRLERALVPLFANWIGRFESILKRVNPYPSVITDADSADVTPVQIEYRELDWSLLAERWVELAFALVRVAREDQNEASFRRWMDRVKQVADRKPRWRARALYEECQYHLFRGDLDGLRGQLDEWSEELDEPGWDLKRAALFAELGRIHEANRLAEGCLERIRGQLEPGTRDLTLLSREGWAIALLRVIQPNLPKSARSWGDLRERLRQLEPLDCDPFPELEEADLILRSPTPEERADANRQVVQRFDPGLKTTTIRHDSGLSVTPFFPAFGFARMLEEGGLPMRCGTVVVQKEAALNAARWIEPYAPPWSLSILLRSVKVSDGMELDDRFGRVRVATMDEKEVERLYDTFAESWVQATRYLTSNPQEMTTSATGFAERLVRVLSDVLSRLSIRLDKPRRSQMLDLALQMYELPLFRQTFKLHDSVSVVLDRLLSQAMSRDEVLS